MSKAVPRIGVIGAGAFGTLHLEVLRSLASRGRAVPVVVAARTADTVDAQCARFGIEGTTDWREVVSRADIDAVTIATPDHLHYEMTLAAIEAGKHVLVEKPLVLNVQEGESIVEKARDRKVLVAVDHHKRYDPTLLALRDALADPAAGRVQYGVMCLEERIGFVTKEIRSWAEKTSPSWVVGIHCYDVVRWLLAEEVVRVYATTLRRRLAAEGIQAVDSMQAHLEFESGAAVTVQTSWILPDEFEGSVNQSLKLVTDNGILEADLQDRGFRYTLAGRPAVTPNPAFLRRRKLHDGSVELSGYGAESIADFVRHVSNVLAGTPVEQLAGFYPSAADGLESVRIAAAVDESVQRGEAVPVPRPAKG